MLRGNFVQMNMDRLVYTRNPYNAVFLTFRGFKKKPDVRTRHRWSEWNFRRNTSNTGRSGFFFSGRSVHFCQIIMD